MLGAKNKGIQQILQQLHVLSASTCAKHPGSLFILSVTGQPFKRLREAFSKEILGGGIPSHHEGHVVLVTCGQNIVA